MDSQDLKHRTKDDTDKNTDTNTDTNRDTDTTMNTNIKNNNNKSRRQKQMAMAKRGLRSLAIAVAIPLSLTLADIYFFGSGQGHVYHTKSKPFWFPSMWALHVTSLASAFLMGLSAWLFWAEGGFRSKPNAMALYLAQLGLALAWDPIVFKMGATRVGLVVCLAMIGALIGCARMFRVVNPIAGDLLMPCLAWAGFLGIVNCKLMYL